MATDDSVVHVHVGLTGILQLSVPDATFSLRVAEDTSKLAQVVVRIA